MAQENIFTLFPWQEDFIKPLARFILQQDELASAVVLLPNARPARYLQREFAAIAQEQGLKALVLPRLMTVQELFELLGAGLELPADVSEAPKQAELLDRVALLYEAVRENTPELQYSVQNGKPNTPDIGPEIQIIGQECPKTTPKAKSEENAGARFKNPLALPVNSPEHFLPWGLRLANLLEDFLNAELLPANYQHLEGVTGEFAALLLSRLGHIQQSYLRLLQEHNLLTPALTAFNVARAARIAQPENSAGNFPFLHGKHFIMAGFYALSGAEETLLHHIWRHNPATVCLHSDPALLQANGHAHWSCQKHAKWLRKWGGKAVLHQDFQAEVTSRPEAKNTAWVQAALFEPNKVSQLAPQQDSKKDNSQNNGQSLLIYEGYDLHSQLYQLRQELKQLSNPQDAAVILPSPDLLLPLLHNLPQKNVNISMGYPLERSALAKLINNIINIQHSKQQGQGEVYYWKDLLEFLRQPCLRMLGGKNNHVLREVLASLEKSILQGPPYISGPELGNLLGQATAACLELETARGTVSLVSRLPAYQEINELLNQAFELGIFTWKDMANLEQMTRLLARLGQFLLLQGMGNSDNQVAEPAKEETAVDASAGATAASTESEYNIWKHFPLDAEYLYRLLRHVLPALHNCLFRQWALSRETLFALLKASLQAERVPFEAEPLEGLQILGMLESRLLSFSHLYILDATEDMLPGVPAQDPLLPDPLRAELGLPALAEREQIAAYHFHRLKNSSRHLSIFYQANVSTSEGEASPAADKKIRSRFIEELLWEKEQERGHLIKAGEKPLQSIALPLRSLGHKSTSVNRTPVINAAMRDFLTRPISPSSLDLYFKCPLRFFYEKIADIQEDNQTPEGEDSLKVGTLIHLVLEDFFRPFVGQKLQPPLADNLKEELELAFRQTLEASPLSQSLPADSLLLLQEAGPYRLKLLLDKTPLTEIVALENEFSAIFEFELEEQHAPEDDPTLRASIQTRSHTRSYTLRGRTDRLDKRPEGFIVLDYKTGGLPQGKKDFWDSGNELWFKMQHWQPDNKSLLQECFEALGGLQLPVYLYAYRQKLQTLPYNAAFVQLADQAEEVPLLKPDLTPEEREEIIERQIPALLTFVFKHMELNPCFEGQPGKHCQSCPWVGLCGE